MEHYQIVKLTMPVIEGACTLENGDDGFGTPATCPAQKDTFTPVDRDYKFTDYPGVIPESGIHKCIKSLSETTPELKTGLSVSSRASGSVVLKDFIGDPNLDSPALQNTPSIEQQGTYFGKLAARNYILNKPVVVEYWETDGFGHTLVTEHNYLAKSLKKNKDDTWTLTFTDVMTRASNDKATYPAEKYETLISRISATDTTVSITDENGITATGWQNMRIGVIGDDLLLITSATNTGSGVDLTVKRLNKIYVGTSASSPITIPPVVGSDIRIIKNTPQEAEAGDTIFYPQVFGDVFDDGGVKYTVNNGNNDIAGVVASVMSEVGITFNETTARTTVEEYLGNNNINAIIYKPFKAMDFLNMLCKSYLVDIYNDIESNSAKLITTSQWATPVATLTEGKDFDYLSDSREESESLRVSRALLRYSKFELTADDKDGNFKRVAVAVNSESEGSNFYGEKKLDDLGETILIGNTDRDNELAQMTVLRQVGRFSDKPDVLRFVQNEDQRGNVSMGDVINFIGHSDQTFAGLNSTKQVQIVQIKPKFGIQRLYEVKAVTYNPDDQTVGNNKIYVQSNKDINLYVQAGQPATSGEYDFIFDGNAVYQNTGTQSITTGTNWPSGSIVNIILLDGATFDSKAGDGGQGGNSTWDGSGWVNTPGQAGGNGGVVLRNQSASITVNVYLDGSRTTGNDSYTCDGVLRASGGGDSGFDATNGQGGNGGDGGKGSIFGNGGNAGRAVGAAGNDGIDGQDNFVNYGVDGTTNGSNAGGLAGSAVINDETSATITIYRTDTTRYIVGNGDGTVENVNTAS